MNKTDAIRECKAEAETLGGEWHVVELAPGEFYSVHKAWFRINSDKRSVFKAGSIDVYDFGKRKNVAGIVIAYLNKFLLWLLSPLIRSKNARRNNSKT